LKCARVLHARCIGWLALLPLCAASRAQGLPGGLGGAVGLATDEVFRGLSQNEGQLSPQFDLHDIVGSWYGGLSADGIRRGEDAGAGAEVIAYAGFQYRLGDDWIDRVTLRHYDYPGNANRTRYDYDELGLSFGWRERVVLSLIASPDTYAADYLGHYGSGAAYCFELAGREPLAYGLSVGAGVGYYDLQRQIGTGYTYWSAGVGDRWRSWVIDLRYVGTDATARHRFEDDAGDRAVLSVFWLF
jgi:uncharacterized protein (TIGR02001 family)